MTTPRYPDLQWPEQFDGNVSIEGWWDKCHGESAPFWLTGSQGPEVWAYLDIHHRLQPGITVLNIGVGLGHCTRALARIGTHVHALDISETALQRVSDVIEQGWLASNLETLPKDTFDLAISNLVAQHMNHETLRAQLEAVISSLRIGGVFALQFSASLNDSENDQASPTLHEQKGGGVMRSLAWMERCVQGAGGAVVRANRIGVFPHCNSCWYGIHIVRKDFPYINTFCPNRAGFITSSDVSHRADQEAFLVTPDWSAAGWVEVLLSFMEAFRPDEPVMLVFVLDASAGTPLTIEAAKMAVEGIIRQTHHRSFPAIHFVDRLGSLQATLQPCTRSQWISSERGAKEDLAGPFGLRLAEARRKLSA